MRAQPGLSALKTLWVVVVVIAAAVSVSLLLRARIHKDIEVPTRCHMNLKLQGTVISMYQAAYNSPWPVSTGPVSNLCEQTVDFRDTLVNFYSGIKSGPDAANLQKALYCPSNVHQDPAELWTKGSVSVWGYVWLNDRGPASKDLPITLPARTPPLAYRTALDYQPPFENASTKEIALDVIESDTTAAPMTFTGKGAPLAFGTNHIEGKPAGANILHLDNHVAWRTFAPATSTPIPQSTGYLWVPNP